MIRLHRDILTSSLLVSSMAVDYPLVLYDCHFEGLDWQRSRDELNYVLSTLQQHWTQSAVQTHVLHGMIKGLEDIGGGRNVSCNVSSMLICYLNTII